ncbi:MAG: hypothetical protein U0528_03630 [Anaerolineae bacterium]|nr:AtpZ/AtpI family protein [Anaerolineae bacterium]
MEQSKLYASVGLALQMGCLLAVLAIVALFVGLFLDRTLNTGRIATVICIVGSIPINLILVLRLTQLFISRIIPRSDIQPTATSGVTGVDDSAKDD